jgi:hypothetical protein
LKPEEVSMQYKTMALELLQERPEIYNQLRKERRLLTALERYAGQLKSSHEAWTGRLSRARPGSDPSQIASEALEIALQELEACLTSPSPAGEGKPTPRDAATAFTRGRKPPG